MPFLIAVSPQAVSMLRYMNRSASFSVLPMMKARAKIRWRRPVPYWLFEAYPARLISTIGLDGQLDERIAKSLRTQLYQPFPLRGGKDLPLWLLAFSLSCHYEYRSPVAARQPETRELKDRETKRRRSRWH